MTCSQTDSIHFYIATNNAVYLRTHYSELEEDQSPISYPSSPTPTPTELLERLADLFVAAGASLTSACTTGAARGSGYASHLPPSPTAGARLTSLWRSPRTRCLTVCEWCLFFVLEWRAPALAHVDLHRVVVAVVLRIAAAARLAALDADGGGVGVGGVAVVADPLGEQALLAFFSRLCFSGSSRGVKNTSKNSG